MKKNNVLMIFIIVVLIAILISGCSKDPDDKVKPIEPAEPDLPKETITDTTRNEEKLNSIRKSSYLIGRFFIRNEEKLNSIRKSSYLIGRFFICKSFN